MLFVSLEAWAQNSDSILGPLLSVGQRKTQAQLRVKEWLNRKALQTHIVKLVETENKELEDFYNPYNTHAPKLQNPTELKFLRLKYGITLDHHQIACHVFLQ